MAASERRRYNVSQPLSSVHSPGEQTTPRVSAYTDGGCDPNPGPGGWAVILRFEGREWTLSGNDPNTTNNRMEIQAAAAALALLEGLLGHCRVSLYTDSQYLRQGITEWIGDWVRRGWRTASGEPVKNQDLWRVLHSLAEQHDVTWHWLKGHAGHPLNERADRLATDALRSLQAKRGQDEAEHETIDDRPSVEISVKASARGAPGPAGWGAVLRMGEHTRTLSGRDPRTTANAMLIHGATAALQVLTRPCQVTVYSDAKYLIQGASQWVTGWQARGWQTRDGKRVANQEAWRALLEAARPHRVTWSLVQNEELPADLVRAGELAGEASGLEKEG